MPRQRPDASAGGLDTVRLQREAALTAAYGAGRGGPVTLAWLRRANDDPLAVWLGSDLLISAARSDGGEQKRAVRVCDVMLPPGATAVEATLAQFQTGLDGFVLEEEADRARHEVGGCWQALEIVQRTPVDARRHEHDARHRRPLLEDALAVVWRRPMAFAVFALPVATGQVAEETHRIELTTRAAGHRGAASDVEQDMARRRYLELYDAQTRGLWQAAVLVGAATRKDLLALASLIAASIDLEDTDWLLRPSNGQVFEQADAEDHDDIGGRAPPWVRLLGSLWTRREKAPTVATDTLARLVRPPIREVPGVRAAIMPEFDLVMEKPGQLVVGRTLDEQLRPVGEFALDDETLSMHTFVTGATGSGKSHTITHLLEQASRRTQPLPWLVLEPAKAEYSQMACRLADLGARGKVYRLRPGAADQVAVGINPLEPCPAPSGTTESFPLQTHADMVRALFLAAFEAQEPFPQVMAAALTRCYEEQGWDLVLSLPRDGRRASRYPRLSDLQRVAKSVVTEIGYGKEVSDNVRGFVDVRLNSLRLGTPGRFLEGGHPLDVERLLTERVVVELEDVGDDQDKAFLMGVVLIRIYEHLRLKYGRSRKVPLHHLLVIEEAHRLLRRVERIGPAAHAIEIFAGMLAEIRAYGQGIVVAEQIPTKILPDVVKNTATKIVHRLPAYDDRHFVGAAMNFTESQSQYVVAMERGTAAAFTDEMDAAVLIHVPDHSAVSETDPSTSHTASDDAAPAQPATASAHELCDRGLPSTSSYSVACAPACRNGSGRCLVAQQRRAVLFEGWDVLRLWAETEVIRRLVGLRASQPVPERLEALRRHWTLDPHLAACAVAQAVEAAVGPRASAIGEECDTEDFVAATAASMCARLGSAPIADEAPHKFRARYWIAGELSRDLKRGISSSPEKLTRLPEWVRDAADSDLASRLKAFADETTRTRDRLVWGSESPSYLEKVTGVSRSDKAFPDRLVPWLSVVDDDGVLRALLGQGKKTM